MEQACLAEILNRNHTCQVRCAGLYADVWYAEGRNKIKDYIRVGDAELLEMVKDGKFVIKSSLLRCCSSEIHFHALT